MRLIASFAGGALLAMTTAYTMHQNQYGFVTDFKEIPASKDLYWFSCYRLNLSCANLLVPLDYEGASSPYIHTAWIKYVSSNDSAEDILVNPGGPGESGINFVIGSRHDLGLQFGMQYNFIGFDPRGVGFSEPKLTCFGDGSPFQYENTYDKMSVPLQELYQRANAFGQHCTRANVWTDAKYAGTVATAKDIMHFVSLRDAQKNRHHTGSSTKRTSIAHRRKIDAAPTGEAKLWYYGASYGTVLGQTLAALFPSRIQRMILDGNVDSVQHYSGMTPSDVDSTDAAFHDFFATCYEAGPEKCAYHGNATSVDEIENRYLILLQNLREMPAIYSKGLEFGVITDLYVTRTMFSGMYSPWYYWPRLAQFLTSLELGSIDSAYRKSLEIPSWYGSTESDKNEAFLFITCLDADKNYAIKSYNDFLDAREVYRKESYYGGTMMSLENLRLCVGMDITPPPSQQFPGFNLSGTHTSFPILFVNPLRDPITPISSAHRMSSLFPGSAVLALNSSGHGTWSSRSRCIDWSMSAYMQRGFLPPPGSVCQSDSKPFYY